MCERCGDERCSDPDSKWCSDILLMRYKAEATALRADAERYRWLREKLVYQKSGPHYGWTLDELIPGDERDAAIDAARNAK